MERCDYTLEVYVQDRRYRSGERLYGKWEYRNQTEAWMQEEIRDLSAAAYPKSKFRFELYETWVLRRNALTGAEFRERYDTPFAASPSSETYWSS